MKIRKFWKVFSRGESSSTATGDDVDVVDAEGRPEAGTEEFGEMAEQGIKETDKRLRKLDRQIQQHGDKRKQLLLKSRDASGHRKQELYRQAKLEGSKKTAKEKAYEMLASGQETLAELHGKNTERVIWEESVSGAFDWTELDADEILGELEESNEEVWDAADTIQRIDDTLDTMAEPDAFEMDFSAEEEEARELSRREQRFEELDGKIEEELREFDDQDLEAA